jgi:hypothetical protein
VDQLAIVGTGRVGTRLAEQVVMDGGVRELALWNRSGGRLAGTVLSLQVWAGMSRRAIRIEELEWEKVARARIVVVCVKERYDPRVRFAEWGDEGMFGVPRDLRYVGLEDDLPLVHDVCKRLSDYAGIVAVVTNPVDVMASLVQKMLPKAVVVGLGASLDAARLAYVLSGRWRATIRPEECALGGEHGKEVVALRSLWSRRVRERLGVASEKRALGEASGLGVTMVKELGYTLQDSALVFGRDLVWLLGKGGANEVRVVSMWSGRCCVGVPVKRRRDGALVRLGGLGGGERKRIAAAERRIGSLADMIAARVGWPERCDCGRR